MSEAMLSKNGFSAQSAAQANLCLKLRPIKPICFVQVDANVVIFTVLANQQTHYFKASLIIKTILPITHT